MQTIWNSKYKREKFLYGTEPNNFLKENYTLIPKKGRVISLGEGEGRNAIFLAKEGFNTEALDVSDIALKKLLKQAENENLAITIRHTLIENWYPVSKYDGIIAIFIHLSKKLQEEMFIKSFHALKEGGVFIGEFFSEKQLNYTSGGPKDKELLYYLPHIYSLLESLTCKVIKISEEIINLNEGTGHIGEACVLQVVFQKL